MTKIALIGYGAMGRELERLAPSVGCEIAGVFDVENLITKDSNSKFDVAIDFSLPNAVLGNAAVVSAMGKDIVIGTTGWYEHAQKLEAIQKAHNNGIIWGSNFSVGVQMYFRLVRAASILANDVAELDVMLHEWHHHRKKDSPSGTALTAARIVLEELERKTQIATETQHSAISPTDLHVTSTRGGEVVGKHTLTLDGPSDSIEITHYAKDRSGFAKGALIAARWIQGKKGVFDFTEEFSRVVSGDW